MPIYMYRREYMGVIRIRDLQITRKDHSIKYILPPSVFVSINPEPLKIFTGVKNLFLEHPVPHKVQ